MKPDIWMNGEFVPWDKACIHPLCHSLQRGSTIFESIDCIEAANAKGAVFRLTEHIERFKNSARLVGMPLGYTLETLSDAVAATVARSGMKKCVIRPLALYAEPVFDVYPGDLPVTVVIGLNMKKPVKESYALQISRLRKIESISMPVKAKVSGNYIASMIAKSEAIKAGFDDTILLDRDGFVAEGSASNIFMVEKGVLYTSPGDKILQGITRNTIMSITSELKLSLKEEVFTPERLKSADEVFMSSSGLGVMPVHRVDDTIISDGVFGEITKKLRSYYFDVATGRVPKFEHWLTYV